MLTAVMLGWCAVVAAAQTPFEAQASSRQCAAIWRRTAKRNSGKSVVRQRTGFKSGGEAVTGINGFWPIECTAPSLVAGNTTNTFDSAVTAPYVSADDNICGCVESVAQVDPAYTISNGHFGCRPGDQPLASTDIYETQSWCYVRDGRSCPGAWPTDDPNAPGMRQCGGFATTVSNSETKDNCSGDGWCSAPKFTDFFTRWARPSVIEAFNASGVLDQIIDTGEVAGSNIAANNGGGVIQQTSGQYSIVLPASAGAKSVVDMVFGEADVKRATSANGNFFYGGQFLNGLNWPTLDGEQTTVNTRDCPTPEGVPLRANNFLDTSAFGGFVLPCNCYGDCLSPISVGRGITLTQGQQETGKLLYWTATREAAVYIVDDVPSPPSTGNPSPPPSTGNPSPPPSTGNSSPPPSTDKFSAGVIAAIVISSIIGCCFLCVLVACTIATTVPRFYGAGPPKQYQSS